MAPAGGIVATKGAEAQGAEAPIRSVLKIATEVHTYWVQFGVELTCWGRKDGWRGSW